MQTSGFAGGFNCHHFIMNTKRSLRFILLTAIMALSFQANAANIDANMARSMASDFLKHCSAAQPGSFKAPALSDIKLAHAEPSSALVGAHDYYAFNINGGGFIIIAGEDRATQVLGYSDDGNLDFNNMPDNFKALMASYKEEIEWLQAHPDYAVAPRIRTAGNGVAPLIKSMWGQEMPYYLQCPIYNGEYCVVGCVATAMSQVMHYWQYPTTSPSLNSYYCYDIGQTVPALPETNFEYDKMLLSYCHWDWDQSQLVQDTYTDEQAQAVAKLGRYCGQAVRMGYSPEGSGAYVSDQLSAMKTFGYNSEAQDVSRSSWWYENYSTAEWEAMIKEELDAARPILYSASDTYGAGGHAFVCDGYNTEGLFHFNFGWYGTCNGWYASTALNMTHRDGDELRFNSSHEMLLGIAPPDYCLVETELMASNELLVFDDALNVKALDLNVHMSYPSMNFMFALTNANGRRVCSSQAVSVNAQDFEQGSTIEGSITLSSTLEPGTYDLRLYRYATIPRPVTEVSCASGKLQVVNHVAKFGKPFDIADVTLLISYVLNSEKPYVSIADVTALIQAVLNN